MKKVMKHVLDYIKVFPYFYDHIEWNKKLSEVILNRIDFKQGIFFTILPENAAVKNLYAFSNGGIIPHEDQNDIQRIEGPPGNFSIIEKVLTVDKEIGEFVSNFLDKNAARSVVLEDCVSEAKDRNILVDGMELSLYGQEVYYRMHSGTAQQQVYKGLRKVSYCWHSLAVLCQGLGKLPSQLSENDFEAICDAAQFILTTAYDGEGYIIWEKTR